MSFSHPSSDATDRLVIALGDPAGIGMEVTLKALADPRLPDGTEPTRCWLPKNVGANLLQAESPTVPPPDGSQRSRH